MVPHSLGKPEGPLCFFLLLLLILLLFSFFFFSLSFPLLILIPSPLFLMAWNEVERDPTMTVSQPPTGSGRQTSQQPLQAPSWHLSCDECSAATTPQPPRYTCAAASFP